MAIEHPRAEKKGWNVSAQGQEAWWERLLHRLDCERIVRKQLAIDRGERLTIGQRDTL